jgi:hypothetical protein
MHDHYQRLYTVSGLQGALKKDGRWLKVAKGESLWFRFTALHPEIIDAFLEIAAREEPGPGFDDERLQPGAVLAPPVEHEWVRITGFEQPAAGSERLADAGDISTDVSLRFLSPTCFIENGQSLPLPVAVMFLVTCSTSGRMPVLFRSLSKRWVILSRTFIWSTPA